MSRRLAVCGLMLGAWAAAAADAGLAQSCAMCYTSAAAASEGGISALRHGILILLFPPLLIFAGIIVAARRTDARTLSADRNPPHPNDR